MHGLPQVIENSLDFIILVFCSVKSKALIKYEICIFITAFVDASCDNTYDENSKTIHTPNYPSWYPNYKHCTWYVGTQNGSKISVERFSYDLETSRDCRADKLMIYDGSDQYSKRIAYLCGNGTFSGMTSTSNHLFFVFDSDKKSINKGFQFKFSIIGMNMDFSYKLRPDMRIKEEKMNYVLFFNNFISRTPTKFQYWNTAGSLD